MTNIYNVLEERGYIEQATDEEIRNLLGKEPVTFYIGFDPTADSLHVGHFIQIMIMMHMQKAGHRPIALFGGGTGMIGDPSGRSDLRQVLSTEVINNNVKAFQKQISRFIDFSDGKGIMVDNADWLKDLKYIDFIRDIGRHFSVNRMLTYESFKTRLEKGLSFFEFGYMPLQSYDFLKLFEDYDCRLQLGGSDQWSNIISGVDLVRREKHEKVYGLTFKLLANSEGKKMGKTASGALWLDENKTSPYEFYQYWRNVDDADVKKCLALLTFIPMDEVKRLGSLEGAEINEAKKILAFEVTKLVHNEEKALKAQQASASLFGGQGSDQDIPKTELSQAALDENADISSLLVLVDLAKSKSEARRLIKDGGIYINDERATSFDQKITEQDFKDNKLLLRRGKKVYHQIIKK